MLLELRVCLTICCGFVLTLWKGILWSYRKMLHNVVFKSDNLLDD